MGLVYNQIRLKMLKFDKPKSCIKTFCRIFSILNKNHKPTVSASKIILSATPNCIINALENVFFNLFISPLPNSNVRNLEVDAAIELLKKPKRVLPLQQHYKTP